MNGRVIDEKGEALAFVNIYILELKKGTVTKVDGSFYIDKIPKGTYTLIASRIGLENQQKLFSLDQGESIYLNFELKEQISELKEVEITAKSKAEEIRESGYAVEVIETKTYKNLNSDINQLLKNTSGIHIRESGGLGSGFSLSLNGLSGNQIRYFIDGIPMENFGSALTLNNYPVNLIKNVEIYKGVVPISLGADALGGAVNITTDYRKKSFLDATYTYGSFNTHRASVNGQFANKEKGYFVRLSSFYNHSDNNYRIDNAPLFDLELGNNLGIISTKRFHSEYTSGMVNLEAGMVDKKAADLWSIGITHAFNRRNYQHPDNTIDRVLGEFHTTNQTFIASSTYKKSFDKLKLKAYAAAGKIIESVVDTSSKKYNWAGEYQYRSPGNPSGELNQRRTLMRLSDQLFRSNLSADYLLSKTHSLSVNLSQNYLERTGEDEVDELNQSFASPNYINKNILGLAYSYKSKNEKLTFTIFGKQYWYKGKIITQDNLDQEITTAPSFNNSGYGGVLSKELFKGLIGKLSFEQTYRIPEAYEILGDGIYVLPNPDLQAEKSYNANLGLRYSKQMRRLDLNSETNLFLRSAADFIRYNPLGPFGSYENLNNVSTNGVEASIQISYNKFIRLNTNLTYQNISDQTEFDEGLPNTNYQSRVPNIPYFFGNARIGVKPFKENHELTIYWSTLYVHEFFLTWKNLGNPNTKNIIPSQLTHNLEIEYAFNEGKYNVSASINNLTDEAVYDNFNIQKPGRAFYLKLRYFLTK